MPSFGISSVLTIHILIVMMMMDKSDKFSHSADVVSLCCIAVLCQDELAASYLYALAAHCTTYYMKQEA